MKQKQSVEEAVAELDRRRALAMGQGGAKRVADQHAKGRLTARERLALLVDQHSFVEIGQLAHSDRPEIGEQAPADAIVTGVGTVDGRKVCVVAVDSTVMAGATGWVGAHKQARIATLAALKGYPLVSLGDANGARLPDMLGSGFFGAMGTQQGEDFLGLRIEEERIPRVAAALGNAYGDPAFWCAIADYTVMPQNCSVALSGPALVASSVGEKTSHEALGGPDVVAKLTGLISQVTPDEPSAIHSIRRFLSYLPSNASLPPPNAAPLPPRTPPEKLRQLVPEELNHAYDMHKVIDAVVDADTFFELKSLFGRSLITALARIEGRPVGIVANNPVFQAGVFDADSLTKARQLVELCEAFGLPLVFLQDLPGVMIGTAAEKTGVASRVMDLYRSLARVTVPRVSVVIRKAFGFGIFLMGGQGLGADYTAAWASAQIGFMAAGNGVQVLYRRRLAEVRERDGDEAASRLAAELEQGMARDNTPWTAAARDFLHNVIKPEETRRAIVDGLFVGTGYRRRHRR